MHRRLSILLAAIGLALAAAAGSAVVLEETGRWGDPSTEPALIGRVEALLGLRVESVVERAFPGLALPGDEGEVAAVSPDAPTAVGRPRVVRDAPSQFTGDLRDLPPPPAAGPLAPLREEAKPPLAPTVAAATADPVLQGPTPLAAAPAATVSDGLSRTTAGSAVTPPDPVIDVGPNHVVEAVNTAWAIYDKTSRAALASGTFDALIDGTGTPCDTANHGDPVVLYDTIADRWILTDFAWYDADEFTGPFYQCFAVSKTANPVTGGWWFYAFETGQSPAGVTPASHRYLADYPKLGIWPDGIYMTANMFEYDAGTGQWDWSNGRVFAFDRVAMEAGATTSAIAIDLAAQSGNLLPANARVQTGLPATGTPNYVAELWGTQNEVRVWKFHVDWTTPANSWIASAPNGSPTDVSTAAWNSAPTTVPSPTVALDSLYEQPMMQLAYTALPGGESLWLTFTAGTGGGANLAAPRWLELGVTGGTVAAQPVQQGTWAPGGDLHRFMPSLAVDRVGDMALGYSVTSAATNPGIRYAGRLADDPAGTLGQGEQTLKNGGGSQTVHNRWGDYSAMTLDPADGCTFWYVNQHFAVNGTNWQTAIGSFAYPSCLAAPTATTAPVATSTGAAVVGATLSVTTGTWTNSPTAYAYQWQRGTGGGWTAIDGATRSTYTAAAADGGAEVRCLVSASTGTATGSSPSNAIAVAAPAATAAEEAAPTPRVTAVAVPRPTPASLANGLRVTFTPPARTTVTIVVRARGRIVGRITTAVRDARVTIRVPITRAFRRSAAPGERLAVRITGTTDAGARIAPQSAVTRVR